jgi:hypothetical protein
VPPIQANEITPFEIEDKNDFFTTTWLMTTHLQLSWTKLPAIQLKISFGFVYRNKHEVKCTIKMLTVESRSLAGKMDSGQQIDHLSVQQILFRSEELLRNGRQIKKHTCSIELE